MPIESGMQPAMHDQAPLPIAAALSAERCMDTTLGHQRPLPSGARGLHALLNYFGISFRFDYTYTYTLIVVGISFTSVIGALWGYTCTLELHLHS